MRSPPCRTLRPLLAATAVASLAAATPASAAALVEPRMLTQEGLAVALASNVLQSQLRILVASLEGSTTCMALPGAGSVRLLSYRQISKTEVKSAVDIYYDAKCTSPYIAAQATITEAQHAYTIAETDAYTGPKGAKLGSLRLQESASLSTGSGPTILIGLGRFTPANHAPGVDLGLECTITAGTGNKIPPFPCQGGIAQNFPALKAALASVTPLTLTVTGTGNAQKVSFAGSGSVLATGAIGALSITEPSATSLGIGGTYARYGSSSAKGSAAGFSLFPPTPTGWTVTDGSHHAEFSIAVESDTTRDSAGTVIDTTTKQKLASFAVDQSGTGSITYADGTKAAITGWMLGG